MDMAVRDYPPGCGERHDLHLGDGRRHLRLRLHGGDFFFVRVTICTKAMKVCRSALKIDVHWRKSHRVAARVGYDSPSQEPKLY